MKKVVYISLACVLLNANTVDLGNINVISEKTVSDVNKKEVKNADLAEALSKDIISINIIRRNGIANDITLRGQKRDNINVLVDGGKVYGACPNRMDPPTSHVLASNIESIVVNEGPFDEENFGSLSGSVKVTTKKPKMGQDANIQLNVGSYGYKKGVLNISEASENLGVLFTVSKETSKQYKDGNNDTMSQQLDNFISANPAAANRAYKAANKNSDAYTKTSFMGKVYSKLDENKELELSYTANRSKNVLYPSTPMDADYDDSDLFNSKLNITDMGKYSKNLEFNLYTSRVDHPMSNALRNSSNMMGTMAHKLISQISGAKIKNSFDLSNSKIDYGVDISRRNWDGSYTLNGNAMGMNGQDGRSISDVDTTNKAFFTKIKTDLGNFGLEYGLRADTTQITPRQGSQKSRKFNSLGGSVKADYTNENINYFVSIGTASRVPDARELYFYSSSSTNVVGNEDLKQTKNYEVDLGLQNEYGNGKVGAKLFYSKLKDYIYYNSSLASSKFENIDANVYGAELAGSYYLNDFLTLKASLNYTKGEKDTLTTGQTDKDLADMTPLKSIVSLDYDDEKTNIRAEFVGVKSWDDYDSENGETKLPGFATLNLKTTHKFTSKFSLEFGVDNVFDKTYKTSNSHKDLTLVSGGGEVMLLNEPGRYFYTNLNYRF